MQALTLLREHLLSKLEHPADRLITFVENGSVYTVPGDSNKDFQINYQGIIYILGINIDARYICWLVGEWMNTYQPEHTIDDIQFEADILSHTEVDMEYRISFKEVVNVAESEAGVTLTSCLGCPDAGEPMDVTINEQ